MPEYLYQQAGTPDQSHQPQTPKDALSNLLGSNFKLRWQRFKVDNWFNRIPKTSLQYDQEGITLTLENRPPQTIPWRGIEQISRRKPALILYPSNKRQPKIIVQCVPDDVHEQIRQLAEEGIRREQEEQQKRLEAAMREQTSNLRRITLEKEAEIAPLLAPQRWLSYPEMQRIISATENFPKYPDPKVLSLLDVSCQEKYQAVRAISQQPEAEKRRRIHNEHYLATAAPAIAQRMKETAGMTLTTEQARAATTDEPNVKVAAAAGSGKTAVITAKTLHLTEDLKIPEQNVLLLAYNRDAAKEMNQRLRQLGNHAKAYTFHSFAMKIVAAAHRATPDIPPIASDDKARTVFFEQKIKELAKQNPTGPKVIELLDHFGVQEHSVFEFPSESAYVKHVKECQLRTMNGELVKSYEELTIANWLAKHSIPYEYEKKYPATTADVARRQYKPDFYLTEWDTWLEHFALDQKGKPPHGWDGYAEGVTWKRKIHQQQGTRLLESYSWETQKGILESQLARKITELGAGPLQPISQEQLLKRLDQLGRVTQTAETMRKFDDAARSDHTSHQEMLKKANQGNWRELLFLEVYRMLAQAYEQELAQQNGLDFNSLISQATEAVRNGTHQNPYSHILIDEFQDISYNRMLLLQALKQAGAAIYAVGDDWQSIYRFAGSRVDIFNRPRTFLGYTENATLTQTFRSNRGITEPAHHFITKNPAQSQRSILPNKTVPDHGITVIYEDNQKEGIKKAIEEIQARGAHKKQILVLGRYRHTKADLPDQNLQFSTVHAAKGQEADYAIIADLKDGAYGFPSQIQDDPVFRLARTPQPEDQHTEHAEERRLFYVALTRAKAGAYLIASKQNPSPFVREITRENPEIRTIGTAEKICPLCQAGTMSEAYGGKFKVCSMKQVCDYVEPLCYGCQSGFIGISPEGTKAECSNQNCQEPNRKCPACRAGILALRGKEKNPFLGCTQYFSKKKTCTYTEDIQNRSERE